MKRVTARVVEAAMVVAHHAERGRIMATTDGARDAIDDLGSAIARYSAAAKTRIINTLTTIEDTDDAD